MHTCPVKSDLRGVDVGSGVTSGSGQLAQCQEMAASRKLIKGHRVNPLAQQSGNETSLIPRLVYVWGRDFQSRPQLYYTRALRESRDKRCGYFLINTHHFVSQIYFLVSSPHCTRELRTVWEHQARSLGLIQPCARSTRCLQAVNSKSTNNYVNPLIDYIFLWFIYSALARLNPLPTIRNSLKT